MSKPPPPPPPLIIYLWRGVLLDLPPIPARPRRYRIKLEQLERERKVTEEALQPLQTQLLDLDEQLKESATKTSAVKAKIAKNDERIEQILVLITQA